MTREEYRKRWLVKRLEEKQKIEELEAEFEVSELETTAAKLETLRNER